MGCGGIAYGVDAAIFGSLGRFEEICDERTAQSSICTGEENAAFECGHVWIERSRALSELLGKEDLASTIAGNEEFEKMEIQIANLMELDVLKEVPWTANKESFPAKNCEAAKVP